jgi:hypothetical protein
MAVSPALRAAKTAAQSAAFCKAYRQVFVDVGAVSA